MGVNVASFFRYFIHNRTRNFICFIVSVPGFSICFYLRLSPGFSAKLAGLCWLAAGVLYGAYRPSWFRKPLQFARLYNDEANRSKAS